MATYAFPDVKGTISGPGGSINIGYGAGVAEEGITAEYDEDKDGLVAGADGTPMHSLHSSKVGKITVRLLKTSPVNGQLSQMYAQQQGSSSTWGQNTITYTDIARGDSITGRQSAFARHGPVTYAKDAGMNEWVFNVGLLDMTLGTGGA